MGMMSPAQASVAQLDRVLPSEGRGRGFESRRVHHLLSLYYKGTALRTESCPSSEPFAQTQISISSAYFSAVETKADFFNTIGR